MNGNRLKGLVFLLFCVLLSPAFAQQSDKRIEAALRQVGDRLLTQVGDSTSRVLPVQREGGTYLISFEAPLSIEPNILVHHFESVVRNKSLSVHYLVEVRTCQTKDVVYSYEMEHFEQTDLVPCGQRALPEDCYQVLFTAMDELPVVKPTQGNAIPVWVWVLVGLLFIAMVFFMLRNRPTAAKEDPDLIRLGRFAFDTRNSELVLEDYRIELSAKEADLLLLLHGAANQQVEREVILNKVWGDEGDYVGRTLDVFISKLRKKLQPDPGLKIVNIRGVGYKLILNEPAD